MPKPFPKEFRDEVVRVALKREDGVRIRDIAADFGITESCLGNRLGQARRDGQALSEMAEQREARKRIRLLAAMESFFALLQKNVLNRRHRWETRDDLRIQIVTWIERTYHRRRRQACLGRLTPIEHEIIMTPQTATAA